MSPIDIAPIIGGIPHVSVSEGILFEQHDMGSEKIGDKEKKKYYAQQSTMNQHLMELRVTTEKESHAHGLDDRGKLSRNFVAKFLAKGAKGSRSRVGLAKRLFKGRLAAYERLFETIST